MFHPIYEKLFETYGDSLLREAGGYDEEALDRQLTALCPDPTVRLALLTLLFQSYYRWSTDAFAAGLHLGLSLLHDQVRRGGVQEG